MSHMSELDRYIREIIANFKNQGEPIDQAIKDVAREFDISEQQASLFVERLLGEESDGSLQFKDSYTRNRFLGK